MFGNNEEKEIPGNQFGSDVAMTGPAALMFMESGEGMYGARRGNTLSNVDQLDPLEHDISYDMLFP